MYGCGTVGGAELDTWEAWQHRYMSAMEPGRTNTYGVWSQCDLRRGEGFIHLLQKTANLDYPDTLVPEPCRIIEWIIHALIHPLN